MQLGRESISSSITAILELVKNAYDADASLVCLRFADLGTGAARLLIEDDGEGMDYKTLLNDWLFIGTANKQQFRASRKRTAKNRVVSGEKGLGRLGLDRLCRKTTVQTMQKSKAPIELTVDWSHYENSGRRLEDIKHPISELPHLNFDAFTGEPTSPFTHGTRLIMDHLKDDWDNESISDLRDELALLLSPFQPHQEFVIHLNTGGHAPEMDGGLQPATYVLDDALWKVVGSIGSDNTVSIDMTSPRDGFGYRQEPVPWGEFIKGMGTTPACGPLQLEFYYYPRSEDAGSSLVSSKARNAFMQAHQGIRIYRDGVRVKPYGDPKGAGDWLQLSLRKTKSPAAVTRTGDWRVAYYQLVGAVFISYERNPELGDQTNREGLLNNQAFRHLNAFALKIVRFFEDKHSAFMASRKTLPPATEKLKMEAEEATSGARQALEQLSTLLTTATREAASLQPIDAALLEARRKLEAGFEASQKTVEAAQREKLEALEEKNMLSNLASLGILAASFGHETVNDADSLVKFTMRLSDGIKGGDFSELLNSEGLTNAAEAAKRVDAFGRFSLGNLRASKRRRQDFHLLHLTRSVFDQFRVVLVGQRGIDLQLPIANAPDVYIDAFPTDWESIVANLISNAVWALDKKLKKERAISVEFIPEIGESECCLAIDDSGHGLESGTEEMIFRPGYTTKRDADGRDIGTGMGLTLVKAFVEEHSKGRLVAIAHGKLGGARFEMYVPTVTGSQEL